MCYQSLELNRLLEVCIMKKNLGKLAKKEKIGKILANILAIKLANSNKDKTGKLKQPESAGEMRLKKLAKRSK